MLVVYNYTYLTFKFSESFLWLPPQLPLANHVLSICFTSYFRVNDDHRIHDSKTPDDDIFRTLSITYASRNPLMHAGNSCKPENFSEGITNGAIWYEVRGE